MEAGLASTMKDLKIQLKRLRLPQALMCQAVFGQNDKGKQCFGEISLTGCLSGNRKSKREVVGRWLARHAVACPGLASGAAHTFWLCLPSQEPRVGGPGPYTYLKGLHP